MAAPVCTLVPATAELLPAITAAEIASYPADEAASPDSLQYRLANAAGVFKAAVTAVVAGDDGDGDAAPALVGFVCGTCCQGSTLTHDTMSVHDPQGTTLCIHSVVVLEQYRRRGVGRWLVDAYVKAIDAEQPGINLIVLMCKKGLIDFYASAGGFQLVGQSAVVHGADPWFEMRRPSAGAAGGGAADE